MDKVLRATYKIINWAQLFCLRTVCEVVVDPRSYGIIHITEPGTTNIGINSTPHVPVHWWTLLSAVCANTVCYKHKHTYFCGPPITGPAGIHLGRCFRKGCVSRFVLFLFFSFYAVSTSSLFLSRTTFSCISMFIARLFSPRVRSVSF
jgi:hypothetical protein